MINKIIVFFKKITHKIFVPRWLEDKAKLQSQINDIKWYHDFDFGNGLKAQKFTFTSDETIYQRALWKFLEYQLEKIDFRGKSVLDIGSWDGYWSFFAEKHGAREVLSTDDLSQNWSNGKGIHLAKKLMNSSINIRQDLSVYNLTSLNKKFDIILFLGTYYHLLDPIYALVQIRHCCHPDTVVVIEGAIDMNAYGARYNFHDHTCEFAPTRDTLRLMLKATYFTEIQQPFYENSPPFVPNRIFLQCKPAILENDIYKWKPPFGLHAYDPRWNNK